MEENQTIHCSVGSCKYNEGEKCCSLKEVKITPINDCDTQKPDESMCSSYKYEK